MNGFILLLNKMKRINTKRNKATTKNNGNFSNTPYIMKNSPLVFILLICTKRHC